jgi:hypothetical protein
MTAFRAEIAAPTCLKMVVPSLGMFSPPRPSLAAYDRALRSELLSDISKRLSPTTLSSYGGVLSVPHPRAF